MLQPAVVSRSPAPTSLILAVAGRDIAVLASARLLKEHMPNSRRL
jgi:hypothetical protein